MYRLILEKRATKELEKLEHRVRLTVLAASEKLKENPRCAGTKKMKGMDLWRLRVGDYRVIYDIQDDKQLVIILKVGYRSSIYSQN